MEAGPVSPRSSYEEKSAEEDDKTYGDEHEELSLPWSDWQFASYAPSGRRSREDHNRLETVLYVPISLAT